MIPPAPQPLLALLFMATSLHADGSDQDKASCTGDAMTVPRGQPAVMFCTVSTPLTHVAILLSAPGKALQLIFGVDGPGTFSNSGWRLEVRGGEAGLVIPDAQPAQAGEYTWYLGGTHRSVGHTRLSVSDPLVTEAVSTLPAATGTRPPPPAASTMSLILVLLAVIVLVLVLAVIAVLAWRRRHRSQNLQKVPQVSENAVSRRSLQEGDAAEAAIPMVGPSSQDTDSFRLESEAPGGDGGGDSGADSGSRVVGLEEDKQPDPPSNSQDSQARGPEPLHPPHTLAWTRGGGGLTATAPSSDLRADLRGASMGSSCWQATCSGRAAPAQGPRTTAQLDRRTPRAGAQQEARPCLLSLPALAFVLSSRLRLPRMCPPAQGPARLPQPGAGCGQPLAGGAQGSRPPEQGPSLPGSGRPASSCFILQYT